MAGDLIRVFCILGLIGAQISDRSLVAGGIFASAADERKNLKPKDAGVVKQTFIYKNVDNCPIKADVYRTAQEGKRPAVLWIHGGALIAGSRENLRADQRDAYLREGYSVVSIDYRLAPETKLSFILEDLEDAYRWIRSEHAELSVDPERIAVVGHSAGGYLTLMAGIRLQPRPRALVSFYGYGDIIGPWYSQPDPFYNQQPAVTEKEAHAVIRKQPISASGWSERERFYLYCRQQGLWPKEVAGFDPVREPERFRAFCPIQNVTAGYPPTMLLHGTKDTDVPYELSASMAEELRKHAIDCELVTVLDGPHVFDGRQDGLSDNRNREIFQKALNFLRKHLDPATEAAQ